MFSFLKKRKLVVTHNGTFHADDMFACAVVSLWMKKHNTPWRLVRTRDMAIIEKADVVFDVGLVHDPAHMRFDHHQKGGAGFHKNSIPFAAFGLVWESLGKELCDGNEFVWEGIERLLVCEIDAADNGVDTSTPKFEGVFPYTVGAYFKMNLPTWKEKEIDKDVLFKRNVIIAAQILDREITRLRHMSEAFSVLEKDYAESADKRLVITSTPFSRGEIQKYIQPLRFPELVYVVFPDQDYGRWRVLCGYTEKGIFDMKKPLPESWRTLRGEAFQKMTGVPSADFCHQSGFFASADSREGAIELAQKALAA